MECSAFVSAFKGYTDLPYEDSLSYAVRKEVCPRIATTNEGKTEGMVFHHEQAQAPRYPSKLFFYCEQPATSGGATALSPSWVLYQRLQRSFPDFVRKCEEKGVLYRAVLPPEQDPSKGVGRSWKSFFSCQTREQAEARMKELGYTFHWAENDILHMCTPVLPAVRVAPGTNGVKVFFNQMIAQYFANQREFAQQGGDASLHKFLTFGDGTPIDSVEPLEFANTVAQETAVELQWQARDVVLIDNFLVMHARRAFEGPRKVFASLVS